MKLPVGPLTVGGHQVISDPPPWKPRKHPKSSRSSRREWEPFLLVIASPLLGQALSYNLQDGFYHSIQQVRLTFTTNLVAAARSVSVGFTPPGSARFATVPAGVPNALTAYTVDFALWGYLAAGVSPQVFGVLNRGVWFPATVLDITGFGMGAGDSITAVSVSGVRYSM